MALAYEQAAQECDKIASLCREQHEYESLLTADECAFNIRALKGEQK
jgi:hypothetical protein